MIRAPISVPLVVMRWTGVIGVVFVVGCQSSTGAPDLESETWDEVEEIVAELTVVAPDLPTGEEWVRTRVAYSAGSFTVESDDEQTGELCLTGVLLRSTQTDSKWPSTRDLKAKGWSLVPLEIADHVSVAPLASDPSDGKMLAHVGVDERVRALVYERGKARLSCSEEVSGEELDACEALNEAGGVPFSRIFLSDPIAPEAIIACAKKGEKRCPALPDAVEDRCGAR